MSSKENKLKRNVIRLYAIEVRFLPTCSREREREAKKYLGEKFYREDAKTL